MLVLYQFLLSFAPAEHARLKVGTTNQAALLNFVLSSENVRLLGLCCANNLLTTMSSPASGEVAARAQAQDLERDGQHARRSSLPRFHRAHPPARAELGEWAGRRSVEACSDTLYPCLQISWKLKSCVPFEKAPLAEAQSDVARNKLKALGRKPKGYMHAMGNPNLSRSWQHNTTTLEGFVPSEA